MRDPEMEERCASLQEDNATLQEQLRSMQEKVAQLKQTIADAEQKAASRIAAEELEAYRRAAVIWPKCRIWSTAAEMH